MSIMTIVDAHIHFENIDTAETFLKHVSQCGAEQFCSLSYERISNDPAAYHLAQSIWLKWKYPTRCFLFGGLDTTGMWDRKQVEPDVPFLRQVQDLVEIGCDGLKSSAGKPTIRKAAGQPLDGPVYEPMFTYLEETKFPMLWHIGDPPEFWSEQTVPLWAKMNRWWYDDTYPAKSVTDRETANVFRKHPKLNLILPHFFFLSNRLDGLGKLLDEHPSFNTDLAPGIEMLHNFTQNRPATREFFLKYQDQIVFGTDVGMGDNATGIGRGPMVRRFIETDDQFPVPEDPYMTPDDRPDLKGIKLPAEVLKKIFAENFYRIIGRRSPRPLNLPKAKAMLQRLAKQSHDAGDKNSMADRALKDMG